MNDPDNLQRRRRLDELSGWELCSTSLTGLWRVYEKKIYQEAVRFSRWFPGSTCFNPRVCRAREAVPTAMDIDAVSSASPIYFDLSERSKGNLQE